MARLIKLIHLGPILYVPGSVVLQFVLVVEFATVWTSEMPPDANPLESDIVTRNLLPLAKGN